MKKWMLIVACHYALAACAQGKWGETPNTDTPEMKEWGKVHFKDSLPIGNSCCFDSDDPDAAKQQYYIRWAYEGVTDKIRDTLGPDFRFPSNDSVEKTSTEPPLPGIIKKNGIVYYNNIYNWGSEAGSGKKTYFYRYPQWEAILEGYGTYIFKSYVYTPAGIVYWQMEVRYTNNIDLNGYFYNRKEHWQVLNFMTSNTDFKIHPFR